MPVGYKDKKMAVPKRRQSKSRRDKRRSTKKISPVQHSICPECKAHKLPHRVCGECGYYGGKEIIKSKLEKSKKEKSKKEK